MKKKIKQLIYRLRLKKIVFPFYKFLVINPCMKKRIRDYNKYNKELLFLVDDALTQKGYRYWLNYGTLLGAFRDKQFIASDNDLDIGMFMEDCKGVVETLTNAGLRLFAMMRFVDFNCIEYRFEYNNTFIDINFYILENNKIITYDGNFIPNTDYSSQNIEHPILVEKVENPFDGFMEYSFLGRNFLIPKNTEEYLKVNYGENYMIPCSKSFDYHKVASNLTCFSLNEAHGYFVRYF